jgi:hypothetical protein
MATTKKDKSKTADATIAVAIKTFGNNKSFEGLRVKAGQRFAIGKEQGGLPVMSPQRFQQLKSAGLVRGLDDADLKAAPGAASFRAHVRYAEQGQAGAMPAEQGSVRLTPSTRAPAKEGEALPARPTTRAGSRKRTQQKDPPAPGPSNETAAAQAGSQTGAGSPESSSQADQASTPSTFKPRGTRRA